MHVALKQLVPPLKPEYLASASVEITFDSGDKLIVSDLRVLRHAAGTLWVGFPTRSVGMGRIDIVHASARLRREIQDVVLRAYAEYCAQNVCLDAVGITSASNGGER